jgi:predicted kinase
MADVKSRVILFRGLPGVGKTFISNKVAEKLRTAIVRKDDIYDSI